MNLLDSNRILRIYKTMKRNPKKTYILQDFIAISSSWSAKKHLHLLMSLGLIERVNCRYENIHGRRTTWGYRLK